MRRDARRPRHSRLQTGCGRAFSCVRRGFQVANEADIRNWGGSGPIARLGEAVPGTSPPSGYALGNDPPAAAPDAARRASLPPRRGRHARHHVGHRPRAGHQAADQGLLAVPRDDHGLGAARPLLRRLPAALPLDRADPVVAAGRGAVRLRGHRRRLPQEQRHDHGAALQPHEAQPRRRAGPGPHHRGGLCAAWTGPCSNTRSSRA